MRFPAGLGARLLLRRISQTSRSGQTPAIFHLSPQVNHFPPGAQLESVNPDLEWHSPAACVRAADAAGAPLLWLGGAEPLFHPAIGDVASALAESGRYVFLHTSGAGLRQRIHELKPVPGLYLTLEIPMDEAVHSASSAPSNGRATYETVAEALRIARLSGFFLCAHFTANGNVSGPAVAARLKSLEPLRLDGVAVSLGGIHSSPSCDAAATKTLAEVTRLIPSLGWRAFSRHLQVSFQHAQASRELFNREARNAGGCEETA